jgi:hypothetical protein
MISRFSVEIKDVERKRVSEERSDPRCEYVHN